MTKLIRILFFGVALFLFIVVTTSRTQSNNEKMYKGELLAPNMPSVYVSFERFGAQLPLFANEPKERVWLRLNNNSIWRISFCSFRVDRIYGDIGIVHSIKRLPIPAGRVGRGTGTPPGNKAIEVNKFNGYSSGDTCQAYVLDSGKSVSFSIPRASIGDSSYVEIEFWYDWENRNNSLGTFPHSFVSFDANELP
jgi:hypothetical protein